MHRLLPLFRGRRHLCYPPRTDTWGLGFRGIGLLNVGAALGLRV